MPAKVSKAGRYVSIPEEMSMDDLDLSNDVIVERVVCLGGATQALFQGCTALKSASLYGGSFELINIAGASAIVEIEAEDNSLAQVLMGSNGALTRLKLANNALEDIDVSPAPQINNLDISNNALTESAVDGVLATLDSNGVEGGEVDLSGGTNSAPSAAGLLSKAALEGKGWAVTVNE